MASNAHEAIRTAAVILAAMTVGGMALALAPKAIDVLVDVGWYYADPARATQFKADIERSKARSADAILSFCATVLRVAAEQPGSVHVSPKLMAMCESYLPEVKPHG